MSTVLTVPGALEAFRTTLSYTAEFWRVLPQARILPAGGPLFDDLAKAYQDEESSLFLSWLQWTDGWHASGNGLLHNWYLIASDWPPPRDKAVEELQRHSLPQNSARHRVSVRYSKRQK